MSSKLKYRIYYLTAKRPGKRGGWMTKKLKELLSKNENICSYCGTPVVRNMLGGKSADNVATVDHVYSNLDIRRFLADKEVVLSCYKCNIDKGAEVHKNVFHVDGYKGSDVDVRLSSNLLINLLK